MRILGAALLLCVASGVAGCATQQPQFPAQVAKLRRVAVLAADVEITRIVFSGDNERMITEEDAVRRELPETVAPWLRNKGFSVIPAHIEESDLAADPSLRYPLSLVRSRFEGAAAAARRGQAVGGLGPEVGVLAQHAGADAFVMIAFAGISKSGGQIARDLAVSLLTLGHVIYPTSASLLFAALVDGASGQLHWWSWRQRDRLVYQGPELAEFVRDLFSKWPSWPPPAEPAAHPGKAARPSAASPANSAN